MIVATREASTSGTGTGCLFQALLPVTALKMEFISLEQFSKSIYTSLIFSLGKMQAHSVSGSTLHSHRSQGSATKLLYVSQIQSNFNINICASFYSRPGFCIA